MAHASAVSCFCLTERSLDWAFPLSSGVGAEPAQTALPASSNGKCDDSGTGGRVECVKAMGNEQHKGFRFCFPSQQGQRRFTQTLLVDVCHIHDHPSRKPLGVLHQVNGSTSRVRSVPWNTTQRLDQIRTVDRYSATRSSPYCGSVLSNREMSDWSMQPQRQISKTSRWK